VLVRLPSRELGAQVEDLLDRAFDPHTAAWLLQPDGSWVAHTSPDDEPLTNLQDALVGQHRRRR
jgi:hypothetical protein